jgi:hypothetical protein
MRTQQARTLGAICLLQLLVLLEAGKRQNAVSHTYLADAVNELGGQLTLGAKA